MENQTELKKLLNAAEGNVRSLKNQLNVISKACGRLNAILEKWKLKKPPKIIIGVESLRQKVDQNTKNTVSPFIIGSINVEALSNTKLNTLLEIMGEHEMDMLCLQDTRTKWKQKKSLLELLKAKNSEYKLWIHHIAEGKRSGGVSILLRRNTKCTLLELDTKQVLYERLIAIEIIFKARVVRIINVYYPAGDTAKDESIRNSLNELVYNLMTEAINQNIEVFVMGDFNAVPKKEARSSQTNYKKDINFQTFVKQKQLKVMWNENLIKNPEAYSWNRNDSKSLIDNILSISDMNIEMCFIWKFCISDHRMVGLVIDEKTRSENNGSNSLEEKEMKDFVEKLVESMKKSENAKSLQRNWKDVISLLLNRKKKKPFKSKARCKLTEVCLKMKEWRNQNILLINECVDWLDKKLQFTGGIKDKQNIAQLDIQEFKTWTKKLEHWCMKVKRKEIMSMKKEYIQQIKQRMNTMKKNQLLKNTRKIKNNLLITGFKTQKGIKRDPTTVKKNIREEYRKRFQEQKESKLPKKYKKIIQKLYPKDWKQERILRKVSIQEVVNVISNCPSTAPGWDGVNMEILKYLIRKSSYVKERGEREQNPDIDWLLLKFTDSINKIILGDSIEKQYKKGIVSPIFKLKEFSTKDLYIPSNYRPINVLPIQLRIANRFVTKWIMEFLIERKIISKEQFGFIKGRNTIQLYTIVKSIIERARMNKQSIAAVFIDFSDAYTNVDWKILDELLNLMRLPEDMRWYVKKLYKEVFIQIKTGYGPTREVEVSKGIMMGDPLSPIIFALYIDPLLKYMNSKKSSIKIGDQLFSTLAYADDIVLLEKSIVRMKYRLKEFEEFATVLNMEINTRKTEYMAYTEKGNTSKVDIKIKDQVINKIMRNESFKYLGIPINYQGKDKHATTLAIEKAKKAFEKIPWDYLDFSQKRVIIQAIVFSTLIYPMQVSAIDVKLLDKCESMLSRRIKQQSYISNTMSKEIISIPFSKGGLQYPSLTVTQEKLFAKNMLLLANSENNLIKQTIRENLELSKHKQDYNSLGGKFWKLKEKVNIIQGKPDKDMRLSLYKKIQIPNNEFILMTDGSYEKEDKAGGSMIIVSKIANKTIQQYTMEDVIYQERFKFYASNAARTELITAVVALSKLPKESKVVFYCDCQYVLTCIENYQNVRWIIESMKNIDILLSMKTVIEDNCLAVETKHVKGHSGIKLNELVDQLAKEGRLDGEDVSEITNLVQYTDYIAVKEASLLNTLWQFEYTRKINKLSDKKVKNLENTETIYQVKKLNPLIDVKRSLLWTEMILPNKNLFYYFLKCQMHGDYILNFNEEQLCKICKKQMCSKKHWYLNCENRKQVVEKIIREITVEFLNLGLRKAILLDWNLENTEVTYQRSSMFVLIDPRGIFFEPIMKDIQVEIGETQMKKLCKKILEILYTNFDTISKK